ncbi:MAG: hypothetical protein KDE19_21985 [Caldilineaceae bacterium]|nr:hypothetical protein [Caldilineaceae bacterium]
MDTRRIVDIEASEFNRLLDDFIERETAEMGEVDVPLFYEAIERIYEPVATPTTIELQAQVVDNELQLTLPTTQPAIDVHGNEIQINDLRFIIHLVPSEKVPA